MKRNADRIAQSIQPKRIRAMGACSSAALLLLLAASCGKDHKGGGPPPAPVTVAKAQQKDVPIVLTAIGTVEAYNSVTIKPQVGGEISRVAFEEGQDVAKGDILLVIDPRPYRAALQQAEAALARDRAMLVSAEAQAQRYADLVKKDYVTQQQYDDSVANAGALKASVQADEAAAERARLDLEYCTVRAPIQGRTGNLLVQLGNVVKADETALLVLNQITPVYVSFSVPESYLPEIRRQQSALRLPVRASLPAGGGLHEGELTLVNNEVDPGTGTVLLKAAFPNRDKALWPGSFVNVSITLSVRKGAVVVPESSVQEGQQGYFVFVIQGDTAQMRPVTVGQRMDGEALVEKGVEAGEEVVTDGQLRLFPGAKVEVKSSLAPTAAPDSEQQGDF